MHWVEIGIGTNAKNMRIVGTPGEIFNPSL